MGGAAGTMNGDTDETSHVLEPGQMADPSKILVPVVKGNPISKSNYEVGYKIGEGSFAVVRIGTSIKTKQKIAIKEVYTGDLVPEQLDDLENEMNILSQLRHKNIVQLYEVYRETNTVYMILEYLSGGELFDAICEQEFYKENDARRVIFSITYALQYMHSHGVMHRDLKPENLILVNNQADTDLKLIDFGFVCRFGPDIPKHQNLVGTPGYVAPEMLNGTPYSCEVDMWSLGVILYVLLAGLPPFVAEDSNSLFGLIMAADYSYPPEYWGEVSGSAKDLIDHLLVVDPVQRYTCEQVLNHPWMTNTIGEDRDLSKNLEAMKQWNAKRKMVLSALAVKTCVKFTLAGQRYRQGLLAAARRAKELEEKGISWELPKDEIKRRETAFHKNSAKKS